MSYFQEIFILAMIVFLNIVAVPFLTIGIEHGIKIQLMGISKYQKKTIVPILVALFVIGLAVKILSSAPSFDFIDRCRPFGTGVCIDGRSFTEVKNEIQIDLLKMSGLYIVLPVVIVSGLISAWSLFLRKEKQRDLPDKTVVEQIE